MNQLTPNHINRLFVAQQEITTKEFALIFGSGLGYHLWEKFTDQWQGNLILFLQNLDPNNQTKFLTWLNNN